MKHLPLTAVSVLSALALSVGAFAQDTAQPAPEVETQQSQPLDSSSDTSAAGGESLENWEHERLAELGGETLMNSQGDSIGEIQEFVRSTDDDQIYAVVSSEDALEIDDTTTVELSELRWENESVVYAGDEQELDRMFTEQPYEEASYQPLDESADQQVGLQESDDADVASIEEEV